MRCKCAALMLVLLPVAMPAWGAGDVSVADLALCRDSWLDWKATDPSKLESFGAFLRANFVESSNDGSLTPKSAIAIAGLNVTRVFPGSLGMGLGFSVLVDAQFDAARTAIAGELGMPLGACEASDGMRSCELSIAKQRTVLLMANDPPNDRTTLVGCYYFYEK